VNHTKSWTPPQQGNQDQPQNSSYSNGSASTAPPQQQAAAARPLIGSAWDVSASPDRVRPHHLAEWVEGSAIHPELAAANLQTISGADVLEALVGERLEQLYSRSTHYVTTGEYGTGGMARLLAPLEPIAEAGGWWCSGLDPLNDWAPMDWGCFKPDAPRWDQERNRLRKYEHRIKVAARLIWLRVPRDVAQLVADRFGLELPVAVLIDLDGSGGAFWRWWATELRLPLVLAEGVKKAGALLSAGLPAVAAPGIWNPAPRGDDGRPRLLPELLAVPLQGRAVQVLYDYSDSRKGRRDVARAARRIGWLLLQQGADVLVGVCPGPHKGADDHLAAGGTWEQLAECLQRLAPAPVLSWLRPADRVAPAGQWLADACPIPSPSAARLVTLACPMGSGKTEALALALAPLMAVGVRVVLITHRTSLGAALADRLGLPWADEAAPGSDLRQTGIALCADSLHAGSALQFRASDWAGAVVVIDEAAQVLAHALMSRGTAIADHRPQVLAELAALLQGAAQVLAADAQLSAQVLNTLEAITSTRALLIGSEHQPAAGRTLVAHPSREGWRLELLAHLQARRPLWVSTTAQQADSQNSAQNLAQFIRKHWPTARILVVDSQTIADPDHDAARLASNPNGIASLYDVVICTPAVAAGLSVTLREHFAAVFVFAGGTTSPEAVAQAAARVRDGCPRHVYAPERSPGSALRIGSGTIDPAALIHHLHQHEAAAVAQLLAAGNWSPTSNSAGPWLPLWAELAATQNRQRLAYRATVLGLLEREGYDVRTPTDLDAEQQAEARELGRRRRLRPEQRAQLQRWRIGKAWGLDPGAAPTAEQITAHRKGLDRRHRFGWLVSTPDARTLVARADLAAARRLAPTGTAWAPDLCAQLEGPRLTAADALGLPAWLQRFDWFAADDPALLELQALATSHAASMAQVLGIAPGKRATTTLRQLLALAGYRLEVERRRCGEGRRAAARYRYRVVAEALPAGVSPEAVAAGWRAALQAAACVPASPIQLRGPSRHTLLH